MTELPKDRLSWSIRTKHLIYSLFLDILGAATYIFPIVGESVDLIYAPIYAIALYLMYRTKLKGKAILGSVIGFFEEILPTTDMIPTATIMWLYTYVWKNQDKKRTINQ